MLKSKIAIKKFINDNKISVKVMPNAKENSIKFDEDCVIFRTTSKAQNNEANEALIKYFKKELKMRVSILRGHKTHEKILLVED